MLEAENRSFERAGRLQVFEASVLFHGCVSGAKVLPLGEGSPVWLAKGTLISIAGSWHYQLQQLWGCSCCASIFCPGNSGFTNLTSSFACLDVPVLHKISDLCN